MFHWKLAKEISSFGAYLILFQLTFIIFQLKCFLLSFLITLWTRPLLGLHLHVNRFKVIIFLQAMATTKWQKRHVFCFVNIDLLDCLLLII